MQIRADFRRSLGRESGLQTLDSLFTFSGAAKRIFNGSHFPDPDAVREEFGVEIFGDHLALRVRRKCGPSLGWCERSAIFRQSVRLEGESGYRSQAG